MKKLLFILLAFIVFLSTACDKDDNMTTISNNRDILRCKINGKNWTPAGGGLDIISPYTLEYYSDDDFLVLIAGNSSTNSSLKGAIKFHSQNVSLGEGKITENEGNSHIQNNTNTSGCVNYGDLDSNFDNYIFVTEIDSINYFMKGEFQFSAINDCQDTIRVTDGYFDLNYFFQNVKDR